MTQHDAVDFDDEDEDEDERDYWQEYKDDLALGRIDVDGTHREPDLDPPDCWACYDTGNIVDYETGKLRRCNACGSNLVQACWWRLVGPIRAWWEIRRTKHQQPVDDPWGNPPF
ncbi:hypothetical protein ALI144C_44930 [Actinosynnema sp. ALI-1.44]|uniref:hypothetical protein n=1 Tax=Actinosynnema sp. ALI-1.44 TaxID=1933779 RepID=UPI00097C224D|nr:hypothetical protein [Actinosynnema sp. ALI-1.44]ONI73098.1 hypothetical protein ALI144C_44930 [Actinosynnema sp. ALI-1.44]